MQTPSVVLNTGADIGKDEIVVACAEESFALRKIANRRAELVAWLKGVPAGSRIGMESTSSYHELLAELAHQLGFVVYVLNPKDTRNYAKAMGLRGKTDRVDAKLIARLIAREHERLHPWIMPTPEQRQIDRMIKRRAKISGIRAALRQSLNDNTVKAVVYKDQQAAEQLGEEFHRRLSVRSRLDNQIIGQTTGRPDDRRNQNFKYLLARFMPANVTGKDRRVEAEGVIKAEGSGLDPTHSFRYPEFMARPLRLELAGGLYHVTSRGDGHEDIFLGDDDREAWLEVFGEVCERFNWICHAWCQMSNHYHVLIETPEPNLAKGMRHLNGVYTQRFNRAHSRGGHVFQGRYKAILVERDSYLLELARYVVLNPVRAKMVKRLGDWPWSSYLATCRRAAGPQWLHTEWILTQFGRRPSSAAAKYMRFVHEGACLPSLWSELQGQIYLGSLAFVTRMQALIDEGSTLDEVPRAQRRAIAKALADTERRYERNEAMARAYLSGQYSMAAIARHFRVHYSTVSRAVRKFEKVVG